MLKAEKGHLMENKKIIKDDINFLEYPNWVLNSKSKATIFTIEKPHGKYELICPLGLPNHFDKMVLYYLLYTLHKKKNANSYVLKTTRYEIVKNIFTGITNYGKNRFDRIMMALKKLKSVMINFEGTFYEDGKYTTRYFSMIDEVCLYHETGELVITFRESYIKQLQESRFYKLIDFDQYKKLHKSVSVRMYEILLKSFESDNQWPINIQVLAEKMTFEKRSGAKKYYPSEILRHLKTAINEINKKTDLSVALQYNKETAVCIFKKLKKPKQTFLPATKIKKKSKKILTLAQQMAACLQEFKSLTEDEQNRIHEDIKKQSFFKFLPDEETKIFTYMGMRKEGMQIE